MLPAQLSLISLQKGQSGRLPRDLYAFWMFPHKNDQYDPKYGNVKGPEDHLILWKTHCSTTLALPVHGSPRAHLDWHPWEVWTLMVSSRPLVVLQRGAAGKGFRSNYQALFQSIPRHQETLMWATPKPRRCPMVKVPKQSPTARRPSTTLRKYRNQPSSACPFGKTWNCSRSTSWPLRNRWWNKYRLTFKMHAKIRLIPWMPLVATYCIGALWIVCPPLTPSSAHVDTSAWTIEM